MHSFFFILFNFFSLLTSDHYVCHFTFAYITPPAGFKEEVGAVDAMEEEMGAAAAADADHERVRLVLYE